MYALKRDEQGQITRYQARWVAKGFEQEYGVNYEQTFASVAKSMAIRILFALAAHEDMEIDQMDAVTAFLQSNMQATDVVWVEMPTGFKKGDHACLCYEYQRLHYVCCLCVVLFTCTRQKCSLAR